MDTASRLAKHIERTVTGPMWHGPALAEVLNGVTAADAATRPIASAHTIWELVLHITAWSDIARERMAGRQLGPVSNDVDWPSPATPTAENWSATLAAMRASYESLARDTAALSEEQLSAAVPKSKPTHTVATLLAGVIEHGTYHGGQIALLKRALTTKSGPSNSG